jgi:hypothetical protein
VAWFMVDFIVLEEDPWRRPSPGHWCLLKWKAAPWPGA